MIRNFIVIISFIFLWVSLVASQQEKPKVDYKSDLTKLSDNMPDVKQLIGNVAFHHNGAVITCDTAYMYPDKRFEGRGNVIINSDSTYIYGDKFTYDENSNVARVYAPLIKVIDKDAVLYTRNMEFNTLENKGSFYGGGTLTQTDNLMEALRGDYYTATRDMVLYGEVEMRNDDYVIKTDSIGINLETEFVTFYAKTDIWSSKGDFLQSYSGTYDRAKEYYHFTDSAYVMSEKQEVWADSINYWSTLKESELKKNIQITDTTQKIISFGDYGHYWGALKKVILTQNPSIVAYNQNPEDSTFLRADTIIIVPMLSPVKEIDTTSAFMTDSLGYKSMLDSISPDMTARANEIFDSTGFSHTRDSIIIANQADSTFNIDSTQVRGRTPNPIDTTLNEQDLDVKKEKKEKKIKRSKQPNDSENVEKQDVDSVGVNIEDTNKQKLKKEKPKKEKKIRGLAKWLKAPEVPVDSVTVDSVKVDSVVDSIVVDSILHPRVVDSSDYIIRAFMNTRVFKSDMQSVSDSLMYISLDSTLHLIKNPIVWNDENQITAQLIIVYSKNEELYRSELFDFPIIAQRIDSSRYNQIRGKEMEAFFKDNALDIVYVDGNAQTVFYQQEDGEVGGLFTATSGSMEIMFDSSKIDRIKWINDVVSAIYPIDKITPDVVTLLEGFEWHEGKRPIRREDVCDETIRPSKRSEINMLEKPLFSLTQQIEEEKIKLQQGGVWRDRSEPLPITKEEIIFKN